jgi:hypothetical protein
MFVVIGIKEISEMLFISSGVLLPSIIFEELNHIVALHQTLCIILAIE